MKYVECYNGCKNDMNCILKCSDDQREDLNGCPCWERCPGKTSPIMTSQSEILYLIKCKNISDGCPCEGCADCYECEEACADLDQSYLE